MEINKIDNHIKQKLEDRTFQPSASAWERLSVQIDEQSKTKKKGWFFYIGAAASFLLLVSLGIQFYSTNNTITNPKNNVVIKSKDKQIINDNIEKLIENKPIKEAFVKLNTTNAENLKQPILNKKSKKKKVFNTIDNKKLAIEKHDKLDIEKKIKETQKTSIYNSKKNKALEQDPNSTIKINADDLLYAVTHSPKEVKEYYAKYEIDRTDVLNTIKNELKKSNLKVKPEAILAEVERSIDDDDFQNNFLKSLKRRVTDIASVIASRNN